MTAGASDSSISYPTGRPITSIGLDGNTIMAATVSVRSGTPHVHTAKFIELPELAERVRRAAHPIFMDVDYLELSDAAELDNALSSLLSEPEFQYPLVGVIPGEFVRTWSHAGKDSPEANSTRLQRGIQSLMSANPLAYPQLFGYSETDDGHEKSETALWSARLADVLAIGEKLQKYRKFLGLVSAKTAIADLSRLIAPASSIPVSIADIGKLRTIYAGAYRDRVFFSHSIPVGMARDDIHYFSALPPMVSRTPQLRNELGSLFFPPDVTPSPLFDPALSTPQIECTRFSIQIARFVHRVLQDVWLGIAEPEDVRFYLTGLPRHLTGFRQYVEFKAGVRFSLLSESPPRGFTKADRIEWETIADCLPAVAAAVAFQKRESSRFGMMLRGRRPHRIASANRISEKVTPNEVYLLDRPILQARRNTVLSRTKD